MQGRGAVSGKRVRGAFSVLLGIDREGRPVVVTRVIGSVDSRASPLARRVLLGQLARSGPVRRRQRSLGAFRTRAVIDHDHLLGNAVLVELGPVRLLPPGAL